MNRVERMVLVTSTLEQLRDRGSWGGETHVQKAVYFLQSLMGKDVGYEFVLYKHGPFSFELRDDLNEMVAMKLLEVEPQSPYGPKLRETQAAKTLESKFPAVVDGCSSAVSFVADRLGQLDASELERVATAQLLLSEHQTESDDWVAEELTRVKPHVSKFDANLAVEKVRQFQKDLQAA